jgi:hypothetical protein
LIRGSAVRSQDLPIRAHLKNLVVRRIETRTRRDGRTLVTASASDPLPVWADSIADHVVQHAVPVEPAGGAQLGRALRVDEYQHTEAKVPLVSFST